MEETNGHQGLMDEIGILFSRGETGKLKITNGSREGALFFENGLLVDAHIGILTGFNAINAILALESLSFSFDPSVVQPPRSSLTPSEHVLIRDFLGIKTVESDGSNWVE